jgi:hypothetical protein
MITLKKNKYDRGVTFDNLDGDLSSLEELRSLMRNPQTKWYRVGGMYGSTFVGIDSGNIEEYIYMLEERAQDTIFEETADVDIYDRESETYRDFYDNFYRYDVVGIDPVKFSQIKKVFKTNNWDALYE